MIAVKRRIGAIVVAGSMFVALSSGAALADAAQIIGTAKDDVLIGTSVQDHLVGLGGDDRMFGNGGNDFMGGNKGKDALHGGSGNDTLAGGEGQDVHRGAAGNDTIDADDPLNADNGSRDYVFCGPGDDRVRADSKDIVADDCENVSVRQL